MQADLKTAQMTERSHSLLTTAVDLKSRLDEIVHKPLLSYSVPSWTSGELTKYHRFITLLKERKSKVGGGVVYGELTAERSDAAIQEAGRYWQTETTGLDAPDQMWPAVVSVMAKNSENLIELRKTLNGLEDDYEAHQKNTKQMIAETEAQGNLKPLESSETDQQIKTEIDQLKPRIEAFEAFGVDCVKLARAFLNDLPKPEVSADKGSKAPEDPPKPPAQA